MELPEELAALLVEATHIHLVQAILHAGAHALEEDIAVRLVAEAGNSAEACLRLAEVGSTALGLGVRHLVGLRVVSIAGSTDHVDDAMVLLLLAADIKLHPMSKIALQDFYME